MLPTKHCPLPNAGGLGRLFKLLSNVELIACGELQSCGKRPSTKSQLLSACVSDEPDDKSGINLF